MPEYDEGPITVTMNGKPVIAAIFASVGCVALIMYGFPMLEATKDAYCIWIRRLAQNCALPTQQPPLSKK